MDGHFCPFTIKVQKNQKLLHKVPFPHVLNLWRGCMREGKCQSQLLRTFPGVSGEEVGDFSNTQQMQNRKKYISLGEKEER